MGQEIERKSEAGLATSGPRIGHGGMVTGRRESAQQDYGLSRLVMYTGTAEDVQNYGEDFKRGEFLDDLEKTSFGMKVRIAVVGAWATYSRFDKGQRAPVYSYKGWDNVPASVRADFEFTKDATGKSNAPAGTETINAIVLIQNDDESINPSPYLFRFKRTGMPAWDGKNGIERYDQRFGVCLHELSSVVEKNASGQPYNRLTSRMVVKLAPDNPLRMAIEGCRDQFAAIQAKAEKIDETPDSPDETDIPL